jgi:hypothetical protein
MTPMPVNPEFRRRRRRGLALALLAGLAALAGCAIISSSRAASLPGAGERFEVQITRVALLPGNRDAVFAFIAAEGVLPRVLTGYGPLPAVVGTSGHTGPWDQPGSARVVHLADGSTVREQITQYSTGAHFAYRVWDFGNPTIGALASGARGEWHFEPGDGGTRVSWTYTFAARNGLAALPLSAITQILWRGYMDVCLHNAQRLLAAGAPAA